MEPAEVLERVDQYMNAGKDLAEKLVQRTPTLRAKGRTDIAHKSAMLFFFAKAYKTYQALHVLLSAGFEEDGLILVRSLYEIMLQCRYMAEDPERHAQQFLKFDPVSTWRWYEKLCRANPRFAQSLAPESLGDLERTKVLYDRYSSEFPKTGHHWWGMSLASLAKHVDQGTGESPTYGWYVGAYHQYSEMVHSGVTSAKGYLLKGVHATYVACYPRFTQKAAMPAQDATLYFIDVVGLASEALGVDLKCELKRALEEYGRLSAVRAT